MESTCGNFAVGSAYMLLYLTLSFLIIVNMYIAVILENYSQVKMMSIKYKFGTLLKGDINRRIIKLNFIT